VGSQGKKKRMGESQRGHAGLDSMVCIHAEDVPAASRAGKSFVMPQNRHLAIIVFTSQFAQCCFENAPPSISCTSQCARAAGRIE
jgi:hypothetical protein